MTAAHSVAVHHSDNRLGHYADKTLQVKHVQARNVVLSYIATVAAHLLVAAGAECLVFVLTVVVGAGKDDNAHFLVVTRKGKRVKQLDVRLRSESVATLGAIDGDFGDAIVLFVDDLVVIFNFFPRKIAHGCPSLLLMPGTFWGCTPGFYAGQEFLHYCTVKNGRL